MSEKQFFGTMQSVTTNRPVRREESTESLASLPILGKRKCVSHSTTKLPDTPEEILLSSETDSQDWNDVESVVSEDSGWGAIFKKLQTARKNTTVTGPEPVAVSNMEDARRFGEFCDALVWFNKIIEQKPTRDYQDRKSIQLLYNRADLFDFERIRAKLRQNYGDLLRE